MPSLASAGTNAPATEATGTASATRSKSGARSPGARSPRAGAAAHAGIAAHVQTDADASLAGHHASTCQAFTCQACTVRGLTICGALEPDDQTLLAGLVQHLSLQPHQSIFQEGDAADYVYTITAGCVAMSKSLADGRRQITGFMGPGDFLGLAVEDENHYSAEALSPTHLCRYPRQRFRAVMQSVPALEQRLYALAADELALAQEQILLLGRKTALERLATFLLMMRRRAQQRGLPTNPLRLSMARADVADYLGLTVETVSRGFSKLRAMGAITLDSAELVRLAKPALLQELSGT